MIFNILDISIFRGLAQYSKTQKYMYTAVKFYCTEQKFAESLIIDIFDYTDLHCDRAPIAINNFIAPLSCGQLGDTKSIDAVGWI